MVMTCFSTSITSKPATGPNKSLRRPLRAHFILLLTPGALDRCVNQDDWVRREFEAALSSGRNIVPVREDSVDLTKLQKKCPESMKGLFDFQIATVRHADFDQDIETLLARYITPHKAPQPSAVTTTECIVSPTRLHHGADHLFGREQELAGLDQAWNDPAKHVLTIVAFGGVGKTSLIFEWMARWAATNWLGFDRVFDWSFYSQGTSDQGTASADAFIASALRFFGDDRMAQSVASPWDKGARLAHLVAVSRTLMVLDGVEPLQYPPGPLAGELKDPALATLLKGLALRNPGLCIVTTRERVTELAPFRETTAPEWELEFLQEEAGAALLHQSGAKRAGDAAIKQDDPELRAASREVQGHALSLRLLGGYLALAEGGDIRKRALVKFEDADREFITNPADADKPYGHAFKALAAYEKWLKSGGENGLRQLAVLRLLGLFDRPADSGCLAALRKGPAIAELTEPLVNLSEAKWNITISRLADCGLVSVTSDIPQSEIRNPKSVDAHPLLREYFAKQLRENNLDAWRAAHRRLYEHLCATTKEGDQPTLEDLQPLYQAVAHGCQAGIHEEARAKVYRGRILRGNENYSTVKLGALGADLGAIACFFEQPWNRLLPAFTEAVQGWLLNEAGYTLRALGRLTEALEPMRAGLEMAANLKHWGNAAWGASNLSELELTLGEVTRAVGDAEQSVTYADRSGDAFLRVAFRTTKADALNQAGLWAEAEACFREAEAMQAEWQPEYPLLYSKQGFIYCDLLLATTERAAGAATLERGNLSPLFNLDELSSSELRQVAMGESGDKALDSKALRAISKRATQALQIAEQYNFLLDIAFNHLTLGRAALYASILKSADSQLSAATTHIPSAVDRLRRAGSQQYLPLGLLTRAWLRFMEDNHTGSESPKADLDEAWKIAERGPMKLFMADIHLYRARLFHGVKPYPWATDAGGQVRGPKDDLAAARKLIEDCGYWRRKEELENAEAAAVNW